MESFTFSYSIHLDDLDYSGIVGNANWLIILERARIEMLEQIGFSFSKMMQLKIGGVVAEAVIKFQKPAVFGDQLTVTISPHDPFKYGGILQYDIYNQKGAHCLFADIKIIFINSSGRPEIMPTEISDKLFKDSVAKEGT